MSPLLLYNSTIQFLRLLTCASAARDYVSFLGGSEQPPPGPPTPLAHRNFPEEVWSGGLWECLFKQEVRKCFYSHQKVEEYLQVGGHDSRGVFSSKR